MNARIGFLLLLCCVLLVPVVYALTASASDQDDGQPGVAQWEHLALKHGGTKMTGDLSKQIVRLGNQGWQLVCVVGVARQGDTVETIYYFKRPK